MDVTDVVNPRKSKDPTFLLGIHESSKEATLSKVDWTLREIIPSLKLTYIAPQKWDGWKMKFPIGKAYCQGDTWTFQGG